MTESLPGKCPHCGHALPETSDAICPECRHFVDTLPRFLRADNQAQDATNAVDARVRSTRIRGWLALAAGGFAFAVLRDNQALVLGPIMVIIGLIQIGEAERLKRKLGEPKKAKIGQTESIDPDARAKTKG